MADIASMVGFATSSYFGQLFRSATGRSPKRCRDTMRVGAKTPSRGKPQPNLYTDIRTPCVRVSNKDSITPTAVRHSSRATSRLPAAMHWDDPNQFCRFGRAVACRSNVRDPR